MSIALMFGGGGAAGAGATAPGGSTTQLQFNDAGAFGGDAELTYNKTTNVLTIGTAGVAGAIEWDTGAMSAGSAAAVKVGAHTGDKFAVSKGGGAVTEVLDKSVKQTKSFTILVPTAADTFLVKMAFAQAITIVRFYCSTDTGTATMNAEERAESTPNSAGTDVLSADIVCDSGTRTACASGCDVNTISNGTIAANAPLAFEIVSVASAPQVVNVHVDFTID